MAVVSLDHATIRTADLERARQFYQDIVGLRVGARPPFDFPGFWLYADDNRPVVHLVGVERALPPGGGAFDHIAFLCSDLAAFRARLAAMAVPFRERTVPLLGLQQLFLVDPDGIKVELNFPDTGGVAPDPDTTDGKK